MELLKNDKIEEVVEIAFHRVHKGYSPEDVIICDRLNLEFIKQCNLLIENKTVGELNWAFDNLRKTGKLGKVTEKVVRIKHDRYLHASDISARLVCDKYNISLDELKCYPCYRDEFDKTALDIVPGVSKYRFRKAALKLRKTRKMRPELVCRIADWDRKITSLKATETLKNKYLLPKNPGVYIFRDSTGVLYIGEASNLRIRVYKHLDHSDRKSLAHYFWQNGFGEIWIDIHAFDPDSEGRITKNRRAYESELIYSRKPRFNMQP